MHDAAPPHAQQQHIMLSSGTKVPIPSQNSSISTSRGGNNNSFESFWEVSDVPINSKLKHTT